MAARLGVSATQVEAAAVAELDLTERPDDVSLGAVARRLGIRTQSLYAHVDGSAGLRRLLALHSLDELAEVVSASAVGRDGVEAVEAIVEAQLRYASRHPGRYLASIHPPGDDAELGAAVDRVRGPLDLVLGRAGLDPDARVHWTRLALSTITGFVILRAAGSFTLVADVDDTAAQLVAMLVRELAT